MADENWADEADRQENLSTKVDELSIKQSYNKPEVENSSKFDKNDENYEKPLTQEENSLLQKLLRDKLVQSNQELEIQQRDPNSPLFSVKSFEELRLHDNLLKGIYAMGFNRPSKIQETALPLLLANPPENMIAQSQSGTGKTAAFVLTMLSRIKTGSLYPQCLCLSPTYELALQTGKVVESMGQFLPNLKVAYAVRGNRGKFVTVIYTDIEVFNFVFQDIFFKIILYITNLMILYVLIKCRVLFSLW